LSVYHKPESQIVSVNGSVSLKMAWLPMLLLSWYHKGYMGSELRVGIRLE
jgi:hypothetical protein